MTRKKPFIVAIDGGAASGKGTVARIIAETYGFDYLDTGKLYRATAYRLSQSQDQQKLNIDPQLAAACAMQITQEDLTKKELNNNAIAELASKISSFEEVRKALHQRQRDFVINPPNGKGSVLDGRDIGTVIAPDADVKVFLSASLSVRAKRRFKESVDLKEKTGYIEIYNSLRERDEKDSSRAFAPLLKADDAIEVNSTDFSIQEVSEKIKSLIEPLMNQRQTQQRQE